MRGVTLSRRSFLRLAALSAAAAAGDCDTALPATSPYFPGRYQASELVLGANAWAEALPQILREDDLPLSLDDYYDSCPDGVPVRPLKLPDRIRAAVYYPQNPLGVVDQGMLGPNPLNMPSGPFPVLLYAHGVRYLPAACAGPYPPDRDFQSAHRMLRHVVTYGCVAVAPDLSWVPPDLGSVVSLEEAFDLRARVLVAYVQYLVELNYSLFARQLDLTRVFLVGHSTGAGACATAGRRLAAAPGFQTLAYGFLAPWFRHLPQPPGVDTSIRNLLVIGGGADTISTTDPAQSFAVAGRPKTLVTVPGANHFGYTHLCEEDNTCDPSVGADGTISREGQQITAASYLAALVRWYAFADTTARPYLTSQQVVEGLEYLGVTGIQVRYEAPPPMVKGPP